MQDDVTFGAYLESLRKLDFEDITVQVLQDSEEVILQRNKAQMYRGKDTNNNFIQPYVLPEYALKKHRMNATPGYGNPDYYLTGAYYRDMRFEVDNAEMHIYNVNQKAPYLETRAGGDNQDYGADLLYGLGEQEHNAFVDQDLTPAFYEQVHRELNQGL